MTYIISLSLTIGCANGEIHDTGACSPLHGTGRHAAVAVLSTDMRLSARMLRKSYNALFSAMIPSI